MRKLYSYYRSSAAYRVRIALNLKALDYETIPIHLLRSGGEQHLSEYRAINPAGRIPALIDTDNSDGSAPQTLTQSLAIIEYLDERYPWPPLLGANIDERASIRAVALSIACDIHPLNNLSVLGYLRDELNIEEDRRNRWYRHWVEQGFIGVEAQLRTRSGAFCFGNSPSLADCCLIPQVYNALRFDCSLQHVPTIQRIYQHCMTLETFQRASPEQQPDAA